MKKMMAVRRRITRRGFWRHALVCAVLVGAVLTCGPFRTAGAARNMGQPDQSDEKADVKQSHPVLVSEFSARDTQPDGDLDKHFWSTAKRVSFDEAAFTRASYPQSQTQVASRWTQDHLYLAFWCRYESLNIFQGENPDAERWQLWDKDVVEAFIGPDPERPSHYYEFEVAPNNQWIDLEINLEKHPFNDPHWNSGFEHATRVNAARHIWTTEWRIPITVLSTARVRIDSAWRVNFYRADGAGPDRRDMSWGALPRNLPENSFHQPDSFGLLRFAEPGSAPQSR
jgi:Carbohydrate family 9 binding domain-like